MKRIFSLITLALLLVSCGGGNAEDPAGDTTTAAVENGEETGNQAVTASTDAADNGRKYTEESGIVTYDFSMGSGIDATMTLYFDDYGAREANVVAVKMGGIESTTVSFKKDGWLYNYNTMSKQGTKMKAPDKSVLGPAAPFSSNMPMANSLDHLSNVDDIPEEIRTQYKIEEIEGKEVVGKDTKGISMQPTPGMHLRVYVWNNIPLSMELKGEGQTLTFNAKDLQTGVDIPSDIFEIPDDIVIKEM